MEVMTILSTISAATKAAKDLKEIHDIASSADSKLKLATIIDALAEAKIALSEAREKISELEQKLKVRDDLKEKIKELQRKGNLFFSQQDNLFKCPSCIESGSGIMTLHEKDKNSSHLFCNSCSSDFVNPNYNPPTAFVARASTRRDDWYV